MWSKYILYACAALTSVCLNAAASFGQSCPIHISQSYQLQSENFSIADLLPSNTCPSLLLQAAKMSFGKVPRTGITRILDGADVRERLLSIPVTHQDHLSIETAKIPDRVLVRRAEVKRSCSQLAMDVLPDLQTMVLKSVPRCGLTYIPRGVSLKTTKRHADPALRSWDFVVRCAKPGDCIPFLIRLQGTDDQLSASTKAVVQANSLDTPTFRAGQEANVMWDQGNLRFLLPGTVLDNGKEGDPVRVRLKAGRIVSAKITNSGIYLLPGEFGVRGSDNAR